MSKTHGLSNHRLFSIWRGMRERCYYEKHKSYPNYGAKGIRVCDEWKDDFMAFYNWSISHGYGSEMTIDREKNSENYGPANCKWVTTGEQRRSSSQIVLVTAWGETKVLTDWSRDSRCKVSHGCLRNRFDRDKDNWSTPEEAISTPQMSHMEQRRRMKTNNIITAWGESKIKADWVIDSRCLVKEGGLRKRLNNGWFPEDALSTPPTNLAMSKTGYCSSPVQKVVALF